MGLVIGGFAEDGGVTAVLIRGFVDEDGGVKAGLVRGFADEDGGATAGLIRGFAGEDNVTVDGVVEVSALEETAFGGVFEYEGAGKGLGVFKGLGANCVANFPDLSTERSMMGRPGRLKTSEFLKK